MECPACERETDPGALWCTHCGASLSESRHTKGAPAPPPAPPVPPQRAAPPKSSNAAVIWIVVGSVGVVALLCVGVLAAILFPVFAKAREKARQTSCLSNVRQIGTVAQMYAVDHGNHLPLGASWSSSMGPYIQNRALFICPSDASSPNSSYRMNRAVAGLDTRSLANPADVPCLFESWSGWDRTGDISDVEPRHAGQANIGFIDGHAQSVRAGDESKYDWAATTASSSGSAPEPGSGPLPEAPDGGAKE
ncbi:MAG: DUF1559 domain-containing protein [Armatimonadia bacterium]|nr:DUF1559 domain-containing protein [Armatimonadia bacterium]